jgi:peptidoglycan hydrolase-like protein with peptidoglycan-binding domain
VHGPAIFISYRRKDAAAYARGIAERLGARFDADRVFMDLRIPPGMDFVQAIHEGIRSAGAIIVIIGPAWMVDPVTGENRLDHPEDYVALEVATALADKDVVIPVLVGGATMPRRADLPEAIRPIATREALEITDQRWDYDVGRLADRLAEVLPPAEEPPPGRGAGRGRQERRGVFGYRRVALGAGVAAAVLVAGGIAFALLSGGGGPGPPSGPTTSPTETSPSPSLGSRVLDLGSQGEDVRQLEQRLDQLGFNVGTLDDQFTDQTENAVTAFERCWGLPLNGRVSTPVVDALEDPAIQTGTGGNDVFQGTGQDDIYFGLDGNDTIDGGGGDDKICAGGGNDTVRGGDGNDHLYGGAGDDGLFGEGGDDVLIGFKNADTLDGGTGTDACEIDSTDQSRINCESDIS